MIVDIVSLVAAGLLVALGWRSGAMRQISRIVAIIAVIVGVPFVSPVVRRVVFGEAGRASPGIEVASIVMAGVAIYLAVAIGAWLVIKSLRFLSATLGLFDRMGGAVIGGVKALVLIYLVAVLVVFMEGPLTERDPDNRLGLRGGTVTDLVADHNLLAPWQFPDLDVLHSALAVGSKTAVEPSANGGEIDADAAQFFADERIEKLLEDEELMGWAQAQNFPMTLADSRVREVLNDAELMEQLHRVDWTALEDSHEMDGNT